MSSLAGALDDVEVQHVLLPVRRYVAGRVGDPHDREDIVQETVLRVLQAQDRLQDDALVAYAIVTARHEIASRHRTAQRARRYAPRLLDRTEPARPEELVLAGEEHRALAAALSGLPAERRDELIAHVIEERPLPGSGRGGATAARESAAAAARLARTRAKVRLDFVIALRRAELPTRSCRPVLLALTAGDRRRQQALDAAGHLLTCSCCAELAEPLVHRERALAGLLPVPLLLSEIWRRISQSLSPAGRSVVTAGLGTALVLGVGGVVAGSRSFSGAPAPAAAVQGAVTSAGVPPGPAPAAATASAPRSSAASPSAVAPPAASPPTAPAPSCSDGGGSTELPGPDRLMARVGRAVCARDVRVLAVVADEAFWAAAGPQRVLVVLSGPGESPQHVVAGQRVELAGSVTANAAGLARRLGVSASDGAALLAAQGMHLTVRYADLRTGR